VGRGRPDGGSPDPADALRRRPRALRKR
jgi:hypothetical protein